MQHTTIMNGSHALHDASIKRHLKLLVATLDYAVAAPHQGARRLSSLRLLLSED